jgi:hypothetical protein
VELKAALLLDLQEQKKAIEMAIEMEKGDIDALRAEVGEEKFEVGEYRFTLVKPVSSSLSQGRLLAVGVTAQQIAAAKQKIPGKPYVKVSRLSDKEVIEGSVE